MGSSLVVSTFTLLCNQSSETFSLCKTEAAYPLSSNSLPPLLSPARHTGFCLWIWLLQAPQYVSNQSVPLRLANVTRCHVLQAGQCCRSVTLCVSQCVSRSVCASQCVCLCVCVCLSVCVSLCQCGCLSHCMCLSQCACVSVYCVFSLSHCVSLSVLVCLSLSVHS